jgi:hypothetical protein
MHAVNKKQFVAGPCLIGRQGIYEGFAIVTTLGIESALSSRMVVCTGSSMVLEFALGRPLLCGVGPSLSSAGTGIMDVSLVELMELPRVVGGGEVTLLSQSKRCIFFST